MIPSPSETAEQRFDDIKSDKSRQLLNKTQRNDPDQVLMSVTDSGIGVDPKHAEGFFEAFFTTKTEGMGTGLSISRSIIEAHRGRPVGHPECRTGATFQFTAPISHGVEA
jgi:signal transduction histidine kinase